MDDLEHYSSSDDGMDDAEHFSLSDAETDDLEHYKSCWEIYSPIEQQEMQLNLKRRWLMGLPLSKEAKSDFEGPEFIKKQFLSESLLREDDIFFETARDRVKEAFGEGCTENEDSRFPGNFEPFDMPDTMRRLQSHLDDLTTRGLYHLTMIVRGGSVGELKTRQSMRKAVKESLPQVLQNHKNKCSCEMCRQVYQFLVDLRNFHGDNPMILSPAVYSGKATAIELLKRLESLPSQALYAMSRKLIGNPAKAPYESPRKRFRLLKRVREVSMDMLAELGEKDVLPEPLAKAMTMAVLSLKLIPGLQGCSLTVFHRISPEMRTLQDEIMKAIRILSKQDYLFEQSDKLRRLFDPNGKISSRFSVSMVKKMLTHYLCESCDVDALPLSILDGVAFINQMPKSVGDAGSLEDELEEEVECILDLSAQTKNIALDLIPQTEYHKDFTDAYIEEFQESDYDDYGGEDGSQTQGSGKADGAEAELVEGFGESNDVNFDQSPFTNRENSFSPLVTTADVKSPIPDLFSVGSASSSYSGASVPSGLFKLAECRSSTGTDGIGRTSGLFSPAAAAVCDSLPASCVRFSGNELQRPEAEKNVLEDNKEDPSKLGPPQNHYLAIQEACDGTSKVAYDLVGFMLGELAAAEGIELDAKERFYLKGKYSSDENHSVARKKKKKANRRKDGKVSAIHQAVEKLIPSLNKSAMEKVEKIMGNR